MSISKDQIMQLGFAELMQLKRDVLDAAKSRKSEQAAEYARRLQELRSELGFNVRGGKKNVRRKKKPKDGEMPITNGTAEVEPST